MELRPVLCPQCGASDSYRARYTTGGGWRVSYYICESCGRKYDPYLDSERE
ncbi:primase-helicase zinc-binding domain-containing protein [Haloarcula sp. JP-L23]|uniref:primase-helicase zinc-binding domain-containing protein n=1 Tax=Haloarcula sp. JP-L23 TaxID=2716717 RepID=UPI00140F197C|nr:hypothetical protein G9465_18305 [Haloarcula sp. JP-L23]